MHRSLLDVAALKKYTFTPGRTLQQLGPYIDILLSVEIVTLNPH